MDAHFSGIDRLLPDFKTMHPMGARLPQECVAITQHEFASMIWHTTNRVPSYQNWLDGADLRWVYESHKRWLQVLQWKAPARALGAEVAAAICGRSKRCSPSTPTRASCRTTATR